MARKPYMKPTVKSYGNIASITKSVVKDGGSSDGGLGRLLGIPGFGGGGSN